MTTYSYKFTLSDSESIMLNEALKMMVERCNAEIEKGEAAPYYSWLQSAKEVKQRLHNDTLMMSTSSFDKG